MKKILFFLCSVSIVYCLTGCGKKVERIHPFGWERIDNRLDSLTEVLEWQFIDGVSFDSIAESVDALNALAAADPGNNQKQVRSLYWDARFKMRNDNYDEAIDEFERAERLALKDSADFPYDVARIRWNTEPYYYLLTVETYDKLLDDIEFFEKQEDYSLAAAKCMDIGMLLTDAGDINESMHWLDKADSLYRIAGMEEAIMKNSGNRAKNLLLMGKEKEAENMIRAIVADPRIDRDPIARDVFLYNLYINYYDTDALHKAYNWVKTIDYFSDVQCLYESCLAYEFAKAGEIDSARIYMLKAEDKYENVEDPLFKKIYFEARADVFNALGNADSAYTNLKRMVCINDSINNIAQKDRILNADVLRQLSEHKLELESKRHQATITFVIIIMGVIIVGCALTFFFYQKWRKRREDMIRSQLELERSQRKVMAMQLAMEESGRLVNNMSAEVVKLTQDGNMSASVAQQLETSLKVHESMRNEQGNFIETFGEIDPDFIPKLRERWPELTDTDVKLCVYISLGLDSKHIARQMGIRPESVKQARWRLRKKLDPKGELTIEDALNSLRQ